MLRKISIGLVLVLLAGCGDCGGVQSGLVVSPEGVAYDPVTLRAYWVRGIRLVIVAGKPVVGPEGGFYLPPIATYDPATGHIGLP